MRIASAGKCACMKGFKKGFAPRTDKPQTAQRVRMIYILGLGIVQTLSVLQMHCGLGLHTIYEIMSDFKYQSLGRLFDISEDRMNGSHEVASQFNLL